MLETDRGRGLLDLPSRRGALKVLAGGASLLLNAARSQPLAKARLAWAEVAACHAPIAFAVDNGLFRQRNLDVELSFHGLDGSVILEAIASGKVDIGAHLLLDWLKPLQQGQDVKIISGTHGGCQRILASKSAKIDKVEDLKGKTIAVGAIGGVSHVAFIVTLAKAGLDPQADVNWRVFPFDKLGEVVRRTRSPPWVQTPISSRSSTNSWRSRTRRQASIKIVCAAPWRPAATSYATTAT